MKQKLSRTFPNLNQTSDDLDAFIRGICSHPGNSMLSYVRGADGMIPANIQLSKLEEIHLLYSALFGMGFNIKPFPQRNKSDYRKNLTYYTTELSELVNCSFSKDSEELNSDQKS